MEDQKPDWIISDLYNKSWQIIKKYKILWVFGLAASVSSFSSSSFSNLRSGASNITPKTNVPAVTPGPADNLHQVLGVSTSSFSQSLNHILSNIPPSLIVVIALEVLLLVILWVIISIIYHAWTTGMLLHSVDVALKDQVPTIEVSSAIARSRIKPFIWLQIIPGLVFIFISILVFGVLAALLISGITALKIISVILIIVAIGAFIYALLYLTLSQIWASRLVIDRNLSGKDALSLGYRMSKGRFWKMTLLGFVNNILAGVISLIPIAILVGIIIGGLTSIYSFQKIGVDLIIVGAILLILFIVAWPLLAGILNAFKAAVWTGAFNSIKEKYEE